MKEENEQLRKENNMLKEKIARFEQQLEGKVDHDKKRARVDTFAISYDASTAESERKKAKVEGGAQGPPIGNHSPVMLSFFDADNATSLPPTSMPSSQPFTSSPADMNDILAYSVSREPSNTLDPSDDTSLRCGLCNLVTSCVCPEPMAVQQVLNDSLSGTSGQGSPLDQPMPSNHTSSSILDNLPAYQPPVPLRRKPGGSSTNSVFPVIPLAVSSVSTSKCSGNPNDCMACADDTFGKAFCKAINHSTASSASCSDCPRRSSQSDKVLVDSCCGVVDKCGSSGIAPSGSSTSSSRGPETIPTDDAWRQLKSHPNVAFADLALLAEVVARRSKCMGPRVVISPAPGSITPERSVALGDEREVVDDNQSILPQEPCYQKQVERCSPPRLVPQDVLIECGRRRMREVNADGVREALRLLDSKFTHSARP